MTTLTAMRGFASAGKSTRAYEIAAETGAVVVNRDSLRKMLLGEWWTGKPADEDRVTIAERAQVCAFLEAGVSVIADSTHLRTQYLRKWAKLAAELGADFHVEDVPTDVEHCVMRDRLRGLDGGRTVGENVIRGMARKYPVKSWPTITSPEPFEVIPYTHTPGLPWAVICDLDSTLAEHGPEGRSPYDYTRVSEDVLVEPIRDLLDMWIDDPNNEESERHVLIVSGRDDTCYDDTRRWLVDNDVFCTKLLMRPTGAKDARGNKDADFRVKHQIFNDHIRGRYNIWACIDDRRQVIDMYRAMGLTVLDVAGNDF